MALTKEQIDQYHADGFLLLKDVFTSKEIDTMLVEQDRIIQEDSPKRILEKNGAVRSYFSPEEHSAIFQDVVSSDRLVEPSKQLLGNDIYIHQTKLNTKHAMLGDWWEWHQDYVFWHNDDKMPKPDVLTAMIYMSDVNEFNGPLVVIPGSHKAGIVNIEENDPNQLTDEWLKEYHKSETYLSALTANLKYTLKQQTIADWVEQRGLVSAKSTKGSVLFFHGNLFHASSNNLSPWNRYAFLVTYNSISNTLPEMENPRPAFLANRNFSPIISTNKEIIP
jgi:ectoine hydroxylase